MAESVTFNNAVYIIPDVGESNWGQNLTNYFVAIPSGCYQLSGGTQPLTADLSFGSNYGLLSLYFKSVSSNIAGAGVIRLANSDTIDWRNAANNANLALSVDSSNNLLWNGDIISTSSSSPVLSITGTANQVIASSSTGNVTLSLPQSIATSSTPTFSKLSLGATTNQMAIGAASHVITISSTAPASSQTYTIPDAGGSANVVLDLGNYTIAGTWSFNNAVTAAGFYSGTANPATGGIIRLASTDGIYWRNNANSANIALTKNTSDQLLYSGAEIVDATGHLNLGSVTGTLAVGNGGTNSSTALNSNCVMISSGGKVVELATSTSGYLLQCNGASAPSWVSATPTFSGLTQYGAMYASTTTAIASTAAGTANYVLTANSSAAPTFQQVSLTSASGTVTGTLPVANGGTGKTALSSFVPTVQTFLSGSGTYTTPAAVTWIRVRAVGGGAGGWGSGSSNGTSPGAGVNTTFGTTLIVANGGAIGTYPYGAAGAGGTASLGSGPIGLAVSGGNGSASGISGSTAGESAAAGVGGANPMGGSGGGGAGSGGETGGTAGVANTGAGGGGGGVGTFASGFGGCGGGAGGFVDAIITAPSATYSYVVGGGGSGGGAGSSGTAGGAGGSGGIWVEEHYI